MDALARMLAMIVSTVQYEDRRIVVHRRPTSDRR
jgi:hypothetical protein